MNKPNLDELRKLISTSEPPYLGPETRSGTESLAALNQKLIALIDSWPEQTRRKIQAAVLLWHDHLDASHTIAQNLPDSDGSYLHGILHRREPDYGNAKYWFHRVGKHPAFVELARRVAALLKSKNDRALETKFLPRGEWDPFAFIDACEAAANGRIADSQAEILRAIQRVEIELLLERLAT